MKRFFLPALCLLALTTPVHAADPAAERAALQSRLDRLQTVLAGDVCADPAAARAVLAEPVAAAQSPAATDAVVPRDELVAHLKRAVALMLTKQGSGSGFFITPDTLFTNAHVIEGTQNGEVLVLGPNIGVRRATILAQVKRTGLQGRDYALLRLQGATASATLPLSTTATELQPVIAAGFPGLLIENDIHFQRLLRGTPTGMPDLILSQGSIMAVQNRSSSLPTIAHGAAISAGNSGGPLVDACGRVIGVNIFIRVAVNQASHAGYAIASDDVVRFIKERGVSPTVRNASCR